MDIHAQELCRLYETEYAFRRFPYQTVGDGMSILCHYQQPEDGLMAYTEVMPEFMTFNLCSLSPWGTHSG